jgi:hypothetical protein
VGRINTNNQGEGVVTINAPARLPATVYLQAISVNPALASNLFMQ